jgi:hypothetical protein
MSPNFDLNGKSTLSHRERRLFKRLTEHYKAYHIEKSERKYLF